MAGEVVGIVGLGAMGYPMAANALKGGWQVVGYDVDPERLAAAAALGVRPAGSPRAVALAAEGVVISVVRTHEQTEAVLFGEDGLASAGRSGLHVAVMSTIDPGSMARFAEAAAARGLTLVDAPFSGGPPGAQAGTLAIMLAGPPAAIRRVRPVLASLGKSFFEIGERPGMGQAVKLANQIMLCAALLGTAEGLTLARRFGLEPAQVLPVIQASLGTSWVAEHWETFSRWWEEYTPGTSPLDILNKDMRTLQRQSAELGIELPVSALALERLYEAWRPA